MTGALHVTTIMKTFRSANQNEYARNFQIHLDMIPQLTNISSKDGNFYYTRCTTSGVQLLNSTVTLGVHDKVVSIVTNSEQGRLEIKNDDVALPTPTAEDFARPPKCPVPPE